jgi:hypothetical protein
MDLPVVEEMIPVVLANCDNQIVVVKVNDAKNNAKPTRHIRRFKSVKKIEKL